MEMAVVLLVLIEFGLIVGGILYFRRGLRRLRSDLVRSAQREEKLLRKLDQFEKSTHRLLRRNLDVLARLPWETAEVVAGLYPFQDLDGWLQRWRIECSPSRHLHLVYGCPKSGNATINGTLFGNPVLAESSMFVHLLNPENMRHRAERLAEIPAPYARDSSRTLEKAQSIRNTLEYFGFLEGHQKQDAGGKLHVITPLREPVAAALSYQAFKNHGLSAQEPPAAPWRLPEDGIRLSAARDISPRGSEDPFRYQEEWMRLEFASVFGFDPVQLPFDPIQGYHIHETERIRFLFVRTENFSRLADILADFYRVPAAGIQVISTNRAQDRSDWSDYREHLETFRLPKEYLAELYESSFCRTFYSPAEIEIFRRKWGA